MAIMRFLDRPKTVQYTRAFKFPPRRYHIRMTKEPYRKYSFTRRAVERLLGEPRSNVAYHINRLEKYNAFSPLMRNKSPFLRVEGGRQVLREIETFDLFALKIIASSFDTPRAESVIRRCDEIIALNYATDYNNQKCIKVD